MKPELYSLQIRERIEETLRGRNMFYSWEEDLQGIRVGIRYGGLPEEADYLFIPGFREFKVYVYPHITVIDRNDDSKVMEFLARANTEIDYPGFLDFNSGVLRYKMVVDCEGALPSVGVVEGCLFYPAQALKKYAPGLMAICYDGANIKDAMCMCEMDIEVFEREDPKNLQEAFNALMESLREYYGMSEI